MARHCGRSRWPAATTARSMSATNEGASSRSIGPDATRTVAGGGLGFRDGAAARRTSRRLAGIAWRGSGRLVVADAGNAYLRAVTASGRSSASCRGRRSPSHGSTRKRSRGRRCSGRSRRWTGRTRSPARSARLAAPRGSERFHAGIDVRIDEGTAVRRCATARDVAGLDRRFRYAERVAPRGRGELRPRPRGARTPRRCRLRFPGSSALTTTTAS